MSGSSKKPDVHPTFPTKNPTFGWRDARFSSERW
jgi:transcriptional regulator with XRE-family HTH domain